MKKLLTNFQVVVGLAIILFFVFVGVFAPFLAPHDPLATNMPVRLTDPFYLAEHPLGTDELGRDTLSRLIFGARVSLIVGFSSMVLGGSAGVIVGLVSGYFGGKLDTIIMRLVDVQLAFPGLLLALVIVTILGPSTFNVILAISIFAIPSFSRLTRGSVMAEKKQEYVDAIKALGASDIRVMFVHILPNVMTPIVVQATLFVGSAILTGAALSFLGVGTPPPTPEWGSMLSNGRDFMTRTPHLIRLPGLLILLIVIGTNLVGDGLRDALAPKK